MREPYLKKDYPQMALAFAIKRSPANKQTNRIKVLPKVSRPVKMFKESDSSKPIMNISEASVQSLGDFEPIKSLSRGPKMIGNTRITTTLTNALNTHTFVIGLRVDDNKHFTSCIYLSSNEDKKEEVFLITGECFIASIAACDTGKHVIAVSSKGVLYKTENYGQTGSWTTDEQLKGRNCKQVVINSEGQYALVLTTRELYLSNDYGQTFTSVLDLDSDNGKSLVKGRNNIWFTSVELDKDTMKISIQTNTAQVYLSDDMGATFRVE